MADWLLYGAYGYTGRLLTAEAVRRGHRPVLAGRNKTKLAALAQQHKLDYLVLDLVDGQILEATVADFDLVFHAAGPYSQTSTPMLRACLAGRTHYLDLSGELTVFENTYRHDRQAKERGIALITGAGFDVIPSNCLIQYVVDQLPQVRELQLAVAALGKSSGGTVKTTLETVAEGSKVRRAGRYEKITYGQDVKQVRFSNGKEYLAMAVPWGDLAAAYWATGVPDITTYLAFPRRIINNLRWAGPLAAKALSSNSLRHLGQKIAGWLASGPSEEFRRTRRSYFWVQATGADGQSVEAWLETMEAYQLTAVAGVRCVERLLERPLVGALAPAQAFGADFILEIEGSQRLDALEG